MKRDSQNKKIKILAALLALSFIWNFFIYTNIYAKDSGALFSYVIQLNPQTNNEVLKPFGNEITKRFVFSHNKKFENIFSFKSAFKIEYLKRVLNGKFIFLEFNQEINSQNIFLNDPGFTNNFLDVDKQWGLAKTGFLDAWAKTVGSKNNIIAVIDTGVDATHEDLGSINWVNGFDFINRQGILGRINSDDNGHGTLVAGILGATVNNGIGIVGANWNVSLMPLKALDNTGKGEVTTIAEAIVWAADHEAKIINLSVGGVGFAHDLVLANSITYAFNKNIVIVAAAGNDASSNGINLDTEPVYPICDDNGQNMIIGVTAVDQNDIKPLFSNYGRNCIDVAAPGKRILSTINYDPIIKTIAPNSYAYASGTSLAVPFVSAQAAILKALFPLATNAQIRDRIISTANSIDNINMSQCNGASCRGLLGAGRINVKKSIEDSIYIQNLQDGDLVKNSSTGVVYKIVGGKKKPVSPFVMNQQFLGQTVKTVSNSDINNFPEGPYLTPQEGTLVKLDNEPAVYMILNNQKAPINYNIFIQRNLNFSDVKTVSFAEFNSWITGPFLSPVEGALIRGIKNKTVYWVVGQVLHPINFNFYKDRGLNIFPVTHISDNDLDKFAKGEAYIK